MEVVKQKVMGVPGKVCRSAMGRRGGRERGAAWGGEHGRVQENQETCHIPYPIDFALKLSQDWKYCRDTRSSLHSFS